MTNEQKNALSDFATLHGTGWQEKLFAAWRTGRDVDALPNDKGCYLRQIRNRFGPSFIEKNFPA